MDLVGMFNSLENALDAASLRQQVISNNISNAGNPNFRTQGIAFEDEFSKALTAKKDDDEMNVRPVSLEDDAEENYKIDSGASADKVRAKVFNTGRPADINKEMVNLVKNQIHYTMLADKLSGFMGAVKTTIDSAASIK